MTASYYDAAGAVPHAPAGGTLEPTLERFQKDTADHEMTVLRDDGMYRHLLFRNPKSSPYWFELVTWPGCLVVNGDCGTYVLARLTDMFEFFRGRVNPGYWAEKVRPGGRASVMTYSPERFRQIVTEYAAESAADWPGLPEAIEQDIFGEDIATWDTDTEDGAREALRDFEFGASFTAACSCGEYLEGATDHDAQAWRVSHVKAPYPGGHSTKVTRIEGFRFTDTWEWDLTDYNWTFLWCCHAIRWGIGQYDRLAVPVVVAK